MEKRIKKRLGLGLALLVVVFTMLPWAAFGCGAKPPSEPVNPLGGAINTGGKPDVDKSHGTVGPGGDVNTGGKPDVDKSHGTVGTGGAVNTGGAPAVLKKDAGAK